jgi:hypothetical protein
MTSNATSYVESPISNASITLIFHIIIHTINSTKLKLTDTQLVQKLPAIYGTHNLTHMYRNLRTYQTLYIFSTVEMGEILMIYNSEMKF